MDKEKFDPEVYEFYKAALEGPGFDAPFSVKDVEWLREDEVRRHAAHTAPYEVYEKYDKFIPRDDGDPLMVRVYIPETVHKRMAAEMKNQATAAAQCAAVGQAAAAVRKKDYKGCGAPVILYFHGGGYLMGCVEDHDPLCGKLADECEAVVVSVEYRLAPEFQFPACIDDAVLAAKWAHENAGKFGGDPDKLMAGGDSSGANIAAVLALLGKAGKAPKLSYLILFYGVFGCVDFNESESGKEFGQGDFVLPLNAMNEMMKIYVPDGADPDDLRLCPGKAKDLTGMPPTIVVTAEFDPLRDDGEEFAKRLRNAGSDVECIRMGGMMHGFILYWQSFRRAKELIEDIGGRIKAFSVKKDNA